MCVFLCLWCWIQCDDVRLESSALFPTSASWLCVLSLDRRNLRVQTLRWHISPCAHSGLRRYSDPHPNMRPQDPSTDPQIKCSLRAVNQTTLPHVKLLYWHRSQTELFVLWGLPGLLIISISFLLVFSCSSLFCLAPVIAISHQVAGSRPGSLCLSLKTEQTQVTSQKLPQCFLQQKYGCLCPSRSTHSASLPGGQRSTGSEVLMSWS